MKSIHLLVLTIIFFALASCATPQEIEACVDSAQQKGFLHGLIQGFLAPLTFIISLFSDDVVMYQVNNSGTWYDLGFLLGIGGFSGGIFKSSKRK